jgi:hypothetical protein
LPTSPSSGPQYAFVPPNDKPGTGTVSLVALIISILAACTLIGASVLLRVLKFIFGKVWLVGGHLAGALDRWTQDAMRFFVRTFDAYVVPVAHFFWDWGQAQWSFMYQAVATIADAKGWALHADQHAAAADANGRRAAADALATAEHDLAQARYDLSQQVAQVELEVRDEQVKVDLQIEQALSGLSPAQQAQVEQALAAAMAQVPIIVEQAVAPEISTITDLQTRLATETQRSTAAESALGSQLTTGLAQVLGTAEGFATGAATAAGLAAETAAKAYTDTKPSGLPPDEEQCLEDLCADINPVRKDLGDLGKLLQLLLQDAILAALLALLVQAVADPKAAGDEITAAFGWMTGLGTDLVRVCFEAAGVSL